MEKTTSWVDENGNPIKPSEKGTKDPGSIPGYELVRTYVDANGNVRHIFRKVTAATPKAQVKRLANTGSETSNTVAAGSVYYLQELQQQSENVEKKTKI